jgi:hypothetical protein
MLEGMQRELQDLRAKCVALADERDQVGDVWCVCCCDVV